MNTQNEGLGETYSLGDVNGDGYNDFFGKTQIFGYPNVKLWVGGRNMPYPSDDQANRTWYGTSGGFGRIISNMGDIDGDGVNDIAIGQIPYGDPEYCKEGRIFILRGDTSVIGDTGTVGLINEDHYETGYALYDPYPNPFNPTVKIGYFLSELSLVHLKVFDILGREILTLVNKEETQGNHHLDFNSNEYNLSSGVYFIQLDVLKGGEQKYKECKKIILLK